jgi:hypothetical protein
LSECSECREAKALKGKDVCGICEIVLSRSMMAELPAAVPSHYNISLGKQIDNRDELKKARKEALRAGKVSAWD